MSGMITFIEGAAPGTPPANYVRLYAKADGKLYFKDDVGTETSLQGPTGIQGPTVNVRQTVLYGAVDANGYANFLGAGAALNFNVDATPTNLVMSFSNGDSESKTTLTADASNQGSLATSTVNYLHATYVSASSVTWGSAVIPPQDGYAFDRAQNALMNFEGADTSTTMLDDFGNTWTANGNAQIDTAQFKFGASSLLCDGTGDYIQSTNFTTLGDGTWEASLWFRANALPGGGATALLFGAENAAGVGAMLTIDNNSTNTRVQIRLSSNGSTFDIDNGTRGTTNLSTATWYKVRMVFDALAGTYRIYLSVNGAAETQELSISSTARICAVTQFNIGRDIPGARWDFNGWIDAFRFMRASTKTTTDTPSVSAPAIGDFPVHFFSIPEMKMYEVTSASGTAGTNPGVTQKDRLFVGEADTSGAGVTATRSYALRGEYLSDLFGIATSTAYSKNHNIGTPSQRATLFGIVQTAEQGWLPGDTIVFPDAHLNTTAAGVTVGHSRNTTTVATGSGNFILVPKAGGSSSFSGANWKFRLHVSRSW